MIDIKVLFPTGIRQIDFDRRNMRKGMRKIGQEIAKDAKKRISARGVSSAGDNPARQTGRLRRSIKYKVSRSGFLVRIAPDKIAGQNAFYAAYLRYGVQAKQGGGWRIAPRNNFMTDALDNRSEVVQGILSSTLFESLKPR